MIEDIRWKRVGKEIDQIAVEGSNETVLVIAAGGFVCKLQSLKDSEWIGIELNPDYAEMAERRTSQMGLSLG